MHHHHHTAHHHVHHTTHSMHHNHTYRNRSRYQLNNNTFASENEADKVRRYHKIVGIIMVVCGLALFAGGFFLLIHGTSIDDHDISDPSWFESSRAKGLFIFAGIASMMVGFFVGLSVGILHLTTAGQKPIIDKTLTDYSRPQNDDGKVICPYCGSPNPASNNDCEHCGAPLTEAKTKK